MSDLFHILSTRKLNSSAIRRAREDGFEIRESEFIRIQPRLDKNIVENFENLSEQGKSVLMIFTSANAVYALSEIFESCSEGRMQHLFDLTGNWKIACLAGRTAAAVRELFPTTGILAMGDDAAGLAREIISGYEPGTELVFCCGNQRRSELPELIADRGWHLHEMVLYETLASAVKLDESFDGILFFSPSAVHSFFSLNELPAGTVCFAIGDTTASAIRRHSGALMVVSSEASQEQILETVKSYFLKNDEFERKEG
jgi:uroporphyrinogen-III synthase